MLRFILLLALFAQTVLSHNTRPSPSPGAFRKRLIVFGDSLSDSGEGAWTASEHTLPVDPPYKGHRFSNGLVWNDILAQKKNIDVRNYAIGGATIDNAVVQGFLSNGENYIPVASVKNQVADHLLKKIPRKVDTYVIFAGGNDALGSPDATITGTIVAGLIETQVSQLYKAGVRRLILASIPNLADAPFAQEQPDEVKQYLSQYSVELRAGLMNIVRRWSVMLKIEFADVYTSSSEILANPEAYGFASAETEERTPCYSSFYGDGTGTVCADPEKRAFWDSIHPTTAAHAYIAKTFEQAYNAIN